MVYPANYGKENIATGKAGKAKEGARRLLKEMTNEIAAVMDNYILAAMEIAQVGKTEEEDELKKMEKATLRGRRPDATNTPAEDKQKRARRRRNDENRDIVRL